VRRGRWPPVHRGGPGPGRHPDRFNLSYHPLSLLSLGALGRIQISNFVVTGGLYIAGAGGLLRVPAAIRHAASSALGVGLRDDPDR
jgi:hypothetical protein